MPKTRPPYSPELRRRTVNRSEPVVTRKTWRGSSSRRAAIRPGGRCRGARSVRTRALWAERIEGRREAAAPTAPLNALRDGSLRDDAAEREGLSRPRREARQFRLERDILPKAVAWSARGNAA